MTIREVLNRVQSVREPGMETGDIIKIINGVEAEIFAKIISPRGGEAAPVYTDADIGEQLTAGSPFDDMYVVAILKEIDRRENQITNYNNEEREYKEIFGEFAAWYRRNNMPEQNKTHSVLF